MLKKMKTLNKYFAIALSAAALTSCADLDTEYLGGYVSTDQKGATLAQNPELASASVTGIYASFTSYMSVYSNHFDFGYPAIMLGLDCQTADLNCANTGYDWFTYWKGFTSPTPNGTPSGMTWNHMYQSIKIENDLLATIPADTEDEQLMFFRAQALASRSFCYWVLANTYQFNVQRHPDAPCVPILTDENQAEVASNGAPRATTTEVFVQINKDIDEAISLLSNTSVTPDQVIASGAKRMISLAAAYGLRARYNLTQGKYAEAANDAQAAISNFSGRCYTRDEVAKPGFTNIDDPSWMWGVDVSETDDVCQSGIVNFPSHICTFSGNAYTQVGAWKYISLDLYDAIPSTDVRKGWFLDDDWTSANLSSAQTTYLADYVGDWTLASTTAPYLMPHTNVKYGNYQDQLGNSTNASDVPLMRVEEMYLILAEAQAMSGAPGTGAQTLQQFVQTYRNPSYTCKATTAEDVQDAVFQQKRIELWGEGLIWFDYMRLNKGVDRTNAMASYTYTLKIEPEDPVLIYCIPQSEISANKAISDADNNPSSSRPSPVPSQF